MKAQKFFGGTNPKPTGVGVKQFGHTGKVQNKTGEIPMKITVKQVKPHNQPVTVHRKTGVKQVGSTGELA